MHTPKVFSDDWTFKSDGSRTDFLVFGLAIVRFKFTEGVHVTYSAEYAQLSNYINKGSIPQSSKEFEKAQDTL